MIEPPIDERYERAAEVMAAIAERDEAVALLRKWLDGARMDAWDAADAWQEVSSFLAKLGDGK